MQRWIVGILALGLSTAFTLSAARADCVESPREVPLDENSTVLLKSYDCRAGQAADGPRFTVELHRFSDTAASLIVGKSSSTLLRKAIGDPRVVENEVFATYADLLRRFGTTSEVPKEQGEMRTSLSVTAGAAGIEGVDDLIAGGKMRTMGTSMTSSAGADFPAVDEIAALRKKTIAPGLNYFYEVSCLDEGDNSTDETICKDYDKDTIRMTFWRPLRRDDLANYVRNVKSYNRLLTQFRAELRASGKRSTNTDNPLSEAGLPRTLKLLQFLASDSWPDDLVYLRGDVATACGDDTVRGIDGWGFASTGWTIQLDALLIENASKRPIAINGLLGQRSAKPGLRVAAPSIAATAAPDPVGDIAATLAPGQRLLVPLAIATVADPTARREFEYAGTSREIARRLAANRFSGAGAAEGAPRFHDYLFGPALAISGIVVDGDRVDLQQQQANFFDLTVSSEVGSCPYLMSWSSTEGGWIDHGKVLHEAAGRAGESSDTIVLPGFRPRFRLEEREAEIAFIERAELVVVLRSGGTVALKPEAEALVARDADYLQLMWGDATDISFALPDGIAADDVTESRLTLTGYYERYSSLMAVRSEQGAARFIGGPMPTRRSLVVPAADRLLCPARSSGPRLLKASDSPALSPGPQDQAAVARAVFSAAVHHNRSSIIVFAGPSSSASPGSTSPPWK